MPTFDDALADAAEMSEAMRGLAHATRRVDRPEQLYPVLGDLLGSVRSLEQILGQLATAHETLSDRATDDAGDGPAGRSDAAATVTELRAAAVLISQAEPRLDAGMGAAGRIAWHSEPVSDVRREFINVVFLQGEEADQIFETITLQGADQAIEHLARHDLGDETVDAALENGYVYDQPPVGQLDKTATRDAYTLVYNPFVGHVGLYRQRDALPDPVLIGLEDPPRQAAARTAAERAATQGAERSRRERLGATTVNRPPAASHQVGRGLGR
ncbi:hypothetical protein [Microbacterium azadirachtae]|uniref:Uncharacterized protein n=1 Tax=Microbacterium azadirachtae TaxID=582680 RepID=A0A1I6G9Z8_9MICO|nr:hypothetical protein [Microbacterium azadirachtae]SDL38852.1 hypothetical protein SAMN04488593_0930 [Microbacterium azadirachtae]SEF69837.1 hypothetical protein SAMN04488594_0919 [Microbacterium azadirachtae]SEF70566.1 hypothetical protein SAMN04488592_0928 [Microbacterium azadirachtae]SFR39036.1 hypothetical protein SAMN04488591_0932 [Microbacterium azadirachtae]